MAPSAAEQNDGDDGEVDLPAKDEPENDAEDVEDIKPDDSTDSSGDPGDNDKQPSQPAVPSEPSRTGSETADGQIVPPESLSSPDNSVLERQALVERAEALEIYLRDKLSSEDHGGIYLERNSWEDGGVYLYVWVVKESALNAALAAYPGDSFPIERLKARCSMAQLLKFDAALDDLKLGKGASIRHAFNEADNAVVCTASGTDFKGISSKIEQLAQEFQIPMDCVIIKKAPTENPVT